MIIISLIHNNRIDLVTAATNRQDEGGNLNDSIASIRKSSLIRIFIVTFGPSK